MMRVYKLYISKALLWFYGVELAAFFVAGIGVAVAGFLGRLGPDSPLPWPFLLLPAFALFGVSWCFRFHYRITVRDDATVEFRSIFRKTTTPLLQIKSVRAKRYGIGFVDVAHQGGTVHLLNQFDGFHEFLSNLKAANPGVTIKGC